MLQIDFSEKEMQALHFERFHHPHPRVQLKMEALLLKSHRLPHQTIAAILNIDEFTLRAYLRDYQRGGIEQLKVQRWKGNPNELAPHCDTLKTHFLQHPPATASQAGEQIAELTGIRRKPTQVRQFLKSIGMKPRKMAAIPAKADPQVQHDFLKKKLEPKLEQAIAGERSVFFVDASHFVLAPFLGIVWCFARLFIRAPSGRQRFNVLGALNAISKELTTVCNDTYITSQQVCQLVDMLVALNPGMPLTLVLDNARYQRCALVQEHARHLGVELLFLPSYSPNLNLIERYWKHVKKKCLYGKYYPAFEAFKHAISTCINQAPTQHGTELHSLLTLRFQTFESSVAA